MIFIYLYIYICIIYSISRDLYQHLFFTRWYIATLTHFTVLLKLVQLTVLTCRIPVMHNLCSLVSCLETRDLYRYTSSVLVHPSEVCSRKIMLALGGHMGLIEPKANSSGGFAHWCAPWKWWSSYRLRLWNPTTPSQLPLGPPRPCAPPSGHQTTLARASGTRKGSVSSL